jgi:hypothetical protein
MQESSVAILAEIQDRLSRLISEREFDSPPQRLKLRHSNAVLLGKASIEQQAIATLYDQICAEHKGMHEAANLPEGINPRVSFDHYYNHVAAPLLSELLIWSAHRDYPDISETISIISIQIDDDWNMYAIPKGAS